MESAEKDKKHKEIRKAAYPAVDECVSAILDWIYEGDTAGLERIREKRLEILKKYPKLVEKYPTQLAIIPQAQVPDTLWKKFKRLFK